MAVLGTGAKGDPNRPGLSAAEFEAEPEAIAAAPVEAPVADEPVVEHDDIYNHEENEL